MLHSYAIGIFDPHDIDNLCLFVESALISATAVES
jgi:hypothetical protein